MSYCGSCGKEMPAGALFCPGCGASVRPPAAVPVSTAGPSASRGFSIEEAVAYGWKAMKKNMGLFIGCQLFLFAVWGFFQVGEKLLSHGSAGAASILSVLLVLISLFVQYTLTLGLLSLILTLHDGGVGRFDQLFSRAGQFFPFLGMALLQGLIIIVGIILLVIPGIYWFICYLFSEFFLVDKRLGPIEAMRRSVELTRGHRWKLFLLGLLLLLINLGGALCLLVGLLFTVPTSWMAMVFAYRRLEALAAPVPATPAAEAPIPSASI